MPRLTVVVGRCAPAVAAALLTLATVVAPSALAATPPAAPTGVRYALTRAVTWTDASTDESGFVIERSLGATGWTVVGSVGPNITSFIDPVPLRGTFSHRVRAWNDSGSATSLPFVTQIVSTGANVLITGSASVTSGTAPLTVNLTASVAPVADQVITWYFGDGTTAAGAAVSHTFSATATPTDASTVYAATVYVSQPSITGLGRDIGYAEVPITVNAPPPLPVVAAPTGLSATSPARGQIRLSWTNTPSQADQIRISRCRTKSCSYSVIATLSATATSYLDSKLVSGTYYSYRVTPVDLGTGQTATASITRIRAS